MEPELETYDSETTLQCPKCGGKAKKPSTVPDESLYVMVKCQSPQCGFVGRRFGLKMRPTNSLGGL